MKPNTFAFFKVAFIVYSCLLSIPTIAQTYTPGTKYWDSTGFVEYKAGNLPIIISVPHGGNWSPDSIPTRNCSGCSYVIDSYTRIISWGIYDAIYDMTGCYPHMIMNRLHRRKFDANRDIGDAADGNPLIEQAWYNYHIFIDSAKTQVEQDFQRGLFLDIHGHGHSNQRIELGYLLSKEDFDETDATLNTSTYINKSSIKTLINDNISGATHAALLRGTNSFGTLMHNRGFPSVPSTADPVPDCSGSCYFLGGYNTVRHGSRDNQGAIDAIQIELDSTARSSSHRSTLIDSLAATINDYINLHYNDEYSNNYCSLISPLPIILQDFEANYTEHEHHIRLNWTTASENNNDYFVVERSLDAKEWTTLGTTPGAGNTIQPTTYNFIDKDIQYATQYYYRLQQVDYNGQLDYSPIITIQTPQTSIPTIKIFPNPMHTGRHFSMTNQKNIKKIELYSITGNSIKAERLGEGYLPAQLPPGIYLLKIQLTTGEINSKKLLLN